MEDTTAIAAPIEDAVEAFDSEPARSSVDGVEIITLGCRLNAYESEVMRGHAAAAGLGDAIIINTCAVTAEAVRQARQAIRKARRSNPSARIVVTGCAAQIEPQNFAAMPEVDHVIGNGEKVAAQTWTALATGDSPRVAVNDIMSVRETAGHLETGFGSRARAFVQIQNGCDHRCTFCIIPYGRGPSRSVPAGAVVSEIRSLVAAGHAEVVLTGVDLTSWGSDLPATPRLGSLVRRILRLVPELKRLRISSIDSIEADAELIEAIASEPRLMPHLHLSLQAGDDMILKRMKRRHLRDDAIRFCDEVRRLRPDIAITADLIAGFPTETETMFANTLDLVERCGLAGIHAFPFSPRTGTPAARMPQVDRAMVKARAERLRAAGQCATERHLGSQIGRELSVLIEKPGLGRAEDFTEVRLADTHPVGHIVQVRAGGHDGRRLWAKGGS
ncbi:tRNA (N(6)-L-threonylcarbamoyladenosine(37)-C(2))-methylthiotransferase MtaB [Hyphomicrobium sp. CS1BSMeth3]|uniref:tRNA (N(6)-L-threonylcarbamoyladenosine(37)-C(2))- methylthiotransferase MtaB n=1 Tax=Hyphomicrobium sp. CS1BSMeth3 TaxID=1892844 RepID=UPI0009F95C62|nr:tRNA (N(6)-L-threonylcarbamoyladenosine(37)-C(2))-methylthiotransferase MtaB [Hyphomicrobium sp. CS1BSMeth3]